LQNTRWLSGTVSGFDLSHQLIHSWPRERSSAIRNLRPARLPQLCDFGTISQVPQPRKPTKIEPTSYQLLNFKNLDLFNSSKFNQEICKFCCRRFTYHRPAKWSSYTRAQFQSPRQCNFCCKGGVKQHQEDMKDFKHKHEPPQLKERFSRVNDLLGAFYTIGRRAHTLIEGTPQLEENVRTQGCSTWPAPTNQAVAKLGTVPGPQ